MEESLAIAQSHPFFPGSSFDVEVDAFPRSRSLCTLEVGGLKLPITGFLGGGGGMTMWRSLKRMNKMSEMLEWSFLILNIFNNSKRNKYKNTTSK